ncbi:tetratricopeptide repeat protein [Stenotrophomonas sp. YIM B06876]|uniref:tetratricopeptide repeat protein n=1 Tax=Stenotrophomonas sp. YIM B06876 TaxID=3060211 RepID=UPI0027391DAA|nr:tetratricopeptide repeat protein [Stenotrophomonas sp. YIM B06876]
MEVFRITLPALVLLAGLAITDAQAQTLPKIDEFYFDNDSAAQPLLAVPGDAADAVEQLMKLRERGRKAVEATTQLASLAIAQGRVDLGKSLYQEALAATQVSAVQGRAVRWNHAWDLYRLGETEAALGEWMSLQAASRGNPGWVPPTYALVLWTLGRRDEAVRWYAAAVRTEPQQWSDPDNYLQLLPHWREQDRATLAEVHRAWSGSPPVWP